MSDLERRIVALEQANRRWRCAAFVTGAVLLIGAIGAASAPDTVPDVLQARRIEVLAPDGEPAIVLRANVKGSSLSLSARSPNHTRIVDLAADQEGARMMLMKHKEAPLFSVLVDDAGSALSLFDGREPTQRPRSIILRTAWDSENGQDGASIALARLHAKNPLGAMLCVRDPDDKTALMIGGSGAKNVTLRVDPQDGKLDFLEGGDRIRERNRP